MELREFFRNSLGLAIFGLSKGDYDSAQLCFTAEGMNEPLWLDLDVLPGPGSAKVYWIHTNDHDHNAGTQTYSHSVKNVDRTKIVAPTLDFLLAKFAGHSTVKVKAILKGTGRAPMEHDADSTNWTWPSYYIG